VEIHERRERVSLRWAGEVAETCFRPESLFIPRLHPDKGEKLPGPSRKNCIWRS
jgi:hypothetical protein